MPRSLNARESWWLVDATSNEYPNFRIAVQAKDRGEAEVRAIGGYGDDDVQTLGVYLACPKCRAGGIEEPDMVWGYSWDPKAPIDCPACKGTGISQVKG